MSLAEFDLSISGFAEEAGICGEYGALEFGDIVADAADSGEELGGGFSCCFGKFAGGNAEGFGCKFTSIESGGVAEYGWEAVLANIVADAADDFAGAEWFAEEFNCALSAGFGDDVATGTKFVAELPKVSAGIAVTAVNYGHGE
jgi:hypothetical protein